jgi:hypothetical protein
VCVCVRACVCVCVRACVCVCVRACVCVRSASGRWRAAGNVAATCKQVFHGRIVAADGAGVPGTDEPRAQCQRRQHGQCRRGPVLPRTWRRLWYTRARTNNHVEREGARQLTVVARNSGAAGHHDGPRPDADRGHVRSAGVHARRVGGDRGARAAEHGPGRHGGSPRARPPASAPPAPSLHRPVPAHRRRRPRLCRRRRGTLLLSLSAGPRGLI